MILKEAIHIYDFSVLCGHRGKDEQNLAYKKGFSKLKFPESKHNSIPSRAVDIAPYPIDWDDHKRFYELAGIIKGIAHEKGIEIRWGGNFRGWKDLPHFELRRK